MDYFGRFFTFKKYTKAVVEIGHFIHIIVDIIIFYIYFTDQPIYNEGSSLLMFPFMAFVLFKTAMSIGHYMIQSGIKADASNRQAIGAVMSNLLVFGIFVGNALSIAFSYIKGN